MWKEEQYIERIRCSAIKLYRYSMKRVECVVFQSFDIFSVMVHAIETKNIPT